MCSLAFLSNLVFLQRYGWFSSDSKTFATPSTTIASEHCSNSEGLQQVCSSNMQNLYGEMERIELTKREFNQNNISEGANLAAAEKMSMDISTNPVVCWLILSPLFVCFCLVSLH